MTWQHSNKPIPIRVKSFETNKKAFWGVDCITGKDTFIFINLWSLIWHFNLCIQDFGSEKFETIWKGGQLFWTWWIDCWWFTFFCRWFKRWNKNLKGDTKIWNWLNQFQIRVWVIFGQIWTYLCYNQGHPYDCKANSWPLRYFHPKNTWPVYTHLMENPSL